jgi:ATP/maltotriose-dependent transcriptional regulator MalT
MSSRPDARALEAQAQQAPGPGPPRPETAARPALAARLGALSRRALTLLVAPTGYGKTTLLSDWATAESRAVAWLSLEPADGEPRRFWRRVASAVAPVPGAPVVDETVARILNELALGPELVLVLDDYHAVDSRACDETLGFFLERLPENVCVVLASRFEPELELGSLPSSGQLGRLTADDLRLNVPEIDECVALAAGVRLSAEELSRLEELTEGWAAGVRLAALSLHGAAGLDGFSGSSPEVADYLEEEVLAACSDELRTFVVQTSILDRLYAPMCDALLGRDDSAALLAEAERAGLFLVPLDRARTTFRHHRLVRQLLLDLLPPDAAADLHRGAAALLEAEERIDEAVRHAAAAGGRAAARTLLLRHWRRLTGLERADEAARALAAVDDPSLSLAQAWVAAARREPAAPARGRPRPPWGTGDAALEAALVRAWFSPDDLEGARRLHALVEARRAADPFLVTVSAAALGHALHRAGRDEDALAALAALDTAAAPAAAARGLAVRARARARLGRSAGAAQAERAAAALVARHGLDETAAAALLSTEPPAPDTAAPSRGARARPAGGALSGAELVVLRLLASRLTQREIARELYVSPNTVKTHVSAVYRKLGVSCRRDAVAAARDLNLLPG